MTYDPIFSLLPYPGDVMDRRMGKFKIPAASISFANTFGALSKPASGGDPGAPGRGGSTPTALWGRAAPAAARGKDGV
jgi:hypothetical protein